MIPRPVTAVCAVIIRDGKVLLGKRKDCYASGRWAFPGGHLEGGEEWCEGIERELLEETGMTATHCKFLTVLNIIDREAEAHFIDIYMLVDVGDQEPQVKEKFCAEWKWCGLLNLPCHVMAGTDQALEAWLAKKST